MSILTIVNPGYAAIVQTKRGTIMFNRHDEIMSYALTNYGEFAEDELSVWERFIKPGMTVLDVGANIGIHTIALATMVGEGHVVSFEPQPGMYSMLNANLALNSAQNVTPLRYIVSDESKHVTMPVADMRQQMNFGAFPALKMSADAIQGVGTPVVTIDEMKITPCDFIKIDVEGAELNVLRGAVKTIEQFRPIIQAECNTNEHGGSDANTAELLAWFKARDYRCYWLTTRLARPGNYNGATKLEPGEDRNVLALPVDRTDVFEGLVPCE